MRQSAFCTDNWEMFEREIPWMWSCHFDTDAIFNSTFGFGAVIVRKMPGTSDRGGHRIYQAYGPKLGREYADGLLRGQLKESLAALREKFKE